MAAEISSLMDREPIVFFDGVCNFCNRAVQRILHNEKRTKFYFATLQSSFTTNFFAEHRFQPVKDAIVVFANGRFYERSDALLYIARRLRFPYPLYSAGIIIPRFIRDYFYDIFAARRYRWFGRREVCMIPDAEQRGRFLAVE